MDPILLNFPQSHSLLTFTPEIIHLLRTEIGKEIAQSADLLKAGKLVAIPTETVYGLAANGFSSEAVAGIFEAKGRPHFDPLILHIGDINQLNSLTLSFPEKAKKLAKAFWPGPLTLILPKSNLVPDLVSSGLATVGIRMPRHEMTLELLKSIDFPLAAPSANPFGYISPTTAMHVKDQLSGKIDYILDGGECSVGLESTIVSFPEGEAVILRKGGITIEDIESVIGAVSVQTQSSSNPTAPGMLVSHYAPRTPLLLGSLELLIAENKHRNFAVLGFSETYGQVGEFLSKTGNLSEAAQNLFSALRRLDAQNYELILAEPMPEKGLGVAINDRLRRAEMRN